jgi:hypothetical protein
MKKTLVFFLIISFSFSLLWADNSPEPYAKDEFKPWMKQLRRSEIVTLGSLPFTTLTTSLGYSFYRYAANDFDSAYFPNPFSPSQANLSTEEQKQVLFISLSASLLVGIIDFSISMIKQNKVKEEKVKISEPYTIKRIVIEADE